MRRREQGAADALASGFLAHVEIFDAGEEPARGDVEAVGEDCYTQHLLICPGGQYLNVSGLDGLSQAVGENFGDGIPIPESSCEEIQGFGQACGEGDFDRATRMATSISHYAHIEVRATSCESNTPRILTHPLSISTRNSERL
jgi:hypothetical protein